MIPAPLPTHPAVPRALRILYAEDVVELRDLARHVFVRDGHTIDCGENGADALERFKAAPGGYDLIITDHHMPLMNGLELVQQLRELRFDGRILVFSSELSPHVAAQYRNLAVDRILFKPVFPSVLRKTLLELFPPVAALNPPAMGV